MGWSHFRGIFGSFVIFSKYRRTRLKRLEDTEYFVLLQTNVVVTLEYKVKVNSDDLTGATEHLTV
jgi:hypothetical protein